LSRQVLFLATHDVLYLAQYQTSLYVAVCLLRRVMSSSPNG
jgi:hypothetical protein